MKAKIYITWTPVHNILSPDLKGGIILQIYAVIAISSCTTLENKKYKFSNYLKQNLAIKFGHQKIINSLSHLGGLCRDLNIPVTFFSA